MKLSHGDGPLIDVLLDVLATSGRPA